ncbi:MAG: bifunctional indole-3-glycerol phosphate synthase/phosphoribosylanthranilate isomerase [Treponema sp.]|uniref:phosphoribosylanthranilate isomerase n=1 Tax=Treponema sp. TaxID=166 RepID=UPI00298E2A12|nr:bifunctional indole-3-glycerol phosphate synthase/phosphoribosylanthranilate isomerase [Treponema sp.]MCQ2600561.1 bifunctional indole-3-glycerol phosphate synthase/phosphoribosylanthranilate isomerase [Treponema sp.]
MSEKNVIAEIVERRKKDIAERGYNFGFEIPEKRTRPINPFMESKGVILEVKRASPSKGNIAPDLNSAETAKKYRANGASAISCLTEENYFKGSLKDLMAVCEAVPDVAVLRKDFLIDEEEIDIAYRCGADAVLLISGMLTLEKMLSMTAKCKELGIRALVEVRTVEDADKVLEVKKQYADTIVCGVNSRNLKDFTIDLLVPAMLKEKLGGKVIFESGITTPEAAAKIGSMGFTGILLGEFAARNPEKAGGFVKAFKEADESLCGKKLVALANKVNLRGEKPMVKICGLTRKEDVLLADELGADFVGFIFATEFGRNVYGERFDALKDCLGKVKAFKVAVVTRPETEEAKAAVQLVKDGVLDFVQLHGITYDQMPDYIKDVPHYFAITKKSKTDDFNAAKLFAYGEPRYLQDSGDHNYETDEHLWLAGGVTCENVEELISQFHPELVDVSSGIETSELGIKDKEKLAKFIKTVKG